MEAKMEAMREIELSSNSQNEKGEIEDILDTDGRGRATRYLVKWKGFSDEHNSWVPSSRLAKYKNLLTNYKIRRQKRLTQTSTNKKLSKDNNDDYNEKESPNEPKATSTKPGNKNFEDDSLLDKMKKIPFTERKKENESANCTQREISIETDRNPIDSTVAKNHKKRVSDPVSGSLTKIKKPVEISPIEKKVATPQKNEIELKIDGMEFFDLKRFSSGNKYVTSKDITEAEAIKALEKDLKEADHIKTHQIIDNKLYFTLNWKNAHTDIFYSKHYFIFSEIEKHNTKILVKYLKEYLNPSLI